MKTLLAALLIALPAWALAQTATVWRCGPDSRSFSDAPCAKGQATTYALASRPAEDIESAQALAQRERRLADQLTRDRLQREAANRGNGLAAMPLPQPAVKPAAAPVAKHKRKHRQQHQEQTAGLRPEDAGISRAVARASRRNPG